MDIAITFDIEFDINRAFCPPFEHMPRGRDSLIILVDGVDQGLGRILQYLDMYSLRATFFVEALQSSWFGFDEMGDIARLLFDRGHEVQLHLHPVWLVFDDPAWRMTVSRESPQTFTHDSLPAIAPEFAAKAIKQGIDTFRQWGLPGPSAVRTGNLIVEKEIYTLFAQSGLRVSSSVGLGLYQPRDPDLRLFSASRHFDGVLEIPVSSFVGVDHLLHRKTKLATIIGTGKSELCQLVRKGLQSSMQFMVFLSHVSEFCNMDNDGKPVENRLTADKFSSLCSMIGTTSGLTSVTISELAAKLNSNTEKDVRITMPRLLSAARIFDRPELRRHLD